MIPAAFNEANAIYDAPQGMSPDQCEPINVFAGITPDQTPIRITCWKITKEELEEFRRTGRIWVWHFGAFLQPLALTTNNPFKPMTEHDREQAEDYSI